MELDLPMRRGQPSPQSSTSRWHRFKQARPPQTAWTLWQKACLLWSDTTGQLSQQLGMWLYPAKLHRQWHAYYVPDNRLYIFQNNRYNHHLPIELELESEFDLNVLDSDLVLPLDAFPVSTEATDEFWEIVGIQCHILTPADSIVPGSFQAFLQSFEPWEAALFHMIYKSTNMPRSSNLMLKILKLEASDVIFRGHSVERIEYKHDKSKPDDRRRSTSLARTEEWFKDRSLVLVFSEIPYACLIAYCVSQSDSAWDRKLMVAYLDSNMQSYQEIL